MHPECPPTRRRWLRWIASTGLGAGTVLAGWPLVTRSQAPAAPVSSAAEMAAALARAAITKSAALRSADREIRELLLQVERLESRVAAGFASIEELTATRQALVDRLAEKDREFAVDMKILRDGLTRLGELPEGALAVRRYNDGDVPGALAALDALADALRSAAQPRRDREDAEDARQDPELAKTLQARRRERRGVEDAQPRRDIARLALDAQMRLLLPLDAVIRRFERVVELDPRLSADAVVLARLYRQAGALPAMAAAADDALRRALDADESALALAEAGSARRLLGELPAARTHLAKLLTLRREAAARQPDRPDLQRLHSVAQERVGELAFDSGRLTDAVAAFDKTLELRRALARASDPGPGAQRDLAVALLQLMRVHLERGDVARAQALLDDAKHQAERDPLSVQSSLEGMRDKAVLIARQGDLAWLVGDGERAERLYRDSLVLRKDLVRRDGGSFRLERDLIAVQLRLADLALRRSGNLRQAHDEFRDIASRLRVLRGPTEERSELERDLIMVDMRLNLLRWREGHPGPALSALRASIEKLSHTDQLRPGQYTLRRDLATLQAHCGDIALAQRELIDARKHCETALALRESLLEADGQARSLRASLVVALNKLAVVRVEAGQVAAARPLQQRAAQELDRLLREGRNTLDGVPDSNEVVLSAVLLADAMDDLSYAERIAPVVGEMRRRKQFSADDQAKLDKLKRRARQ